MLLSFILSLIFLNIQNIDSFYLPGISPKVYCNVNKESETCNVSIFEIIEVSFYTDRIFLVTPRCLCQSS